MDMRLTVVTSGESKGCSAMANGFCGWRMGSRES